MRRNNAKPGREHAQSDGKRMESGEARRLFFENWKTIVYAARLELDDKFADSAGEDEHFHIASDLALDTLETILEKAGQYDPARASFKTWACGIARMKAKNYLREYWRARSFPMGNGVREFVDIYTFTDWDAGAASKPQDEGDAMPFDERAIDQAEDERELEHTVNFDEYAQQRERSAFDAALSQAFDQEGGQIAEEYKQVARLIYIDGLSDKDTAARLGIPLGTVKSRLFRANKIIKRIQRESERTLYASPFRGVEIGKRGEWFDFFVLGAPRPAMAERAPGPRDVCERCKHGLVFQSCGLCMYTPDDASKPSPGVFWFRW